MRFLRTVFKCALGIIAAQPVWAACPFDRIDSGFTGPMASVPSFANLAFPAVLFRSGLEIDFDGAPNAYHKGNIDESVDPGFDHICNGGTVLEFKNGRLVDKYGSGGSVGKLGGIDPNTGIGRSKLCKLDYIALRDKGFPSCSSSQNCMLFYGIKVQARACGYENPFGGPNDMRCGVPILQRDDKGELRDFYLTTTAYRRPNANSDSLKQSDYVDAAKIPYIVMPGGQKLPGNIPYEQGDIAVVVRGKHIAYAIIGDAGPSKKIGEASAALLWQLDTKGPVEFTRTPATMTILFPGTRKLLKKEWPVDPNEIKRKARTLLGELGVDDLRACEGLERLQ